MYTYCGMHAAVTGLSVGGGKGRSGEMVGARTRDLMPQQVDGNSGRRTAQDTETALGPGTGESGTWCPSVGVDLDRERSWCWCVLCVDGKVYPCAAWLVRDATGPPKCGATLNLQSHTHGKSGAVRVRSNWDRECARVGVISPRSSQGVESFY